MKMEFPGLFNFFCQSVQHNHYGYHHHYFLISHSHLIFSVIFSFNRLYNDFAFYSNIKLCRAEFYQIRFINTKTWHFSMTNAEHHFDLSKSTWFVVDFLECGTENEMAISNKSHYSGSDKWKWDVVGKDIKSVQHLRHPGQKCTVRLISLIFLC